MSDRRSRPLCQEVTAAAAPDARLLLVEFTPGGSIGVPGVDQAEIERRFAPDWRLLSAGDQPYAANRGTGSALRALPAAAPEPSSELGQRVRRGEPIAVLRGQLPGPRDEALFTAGALVANDYCALPPVQAENRCP